MDTKWFSGAPFGVQSHRWGFPPEAQLESGGGGSDRSGPGSEEWGARLSLRVTLAALLGLGLVHHP